MISKTTILCMCPLSLFLIYNEIQNYFECSRLEQHMLDRKLRFDKRSSDKSWQEPTIKYYKQFITDKDLTKEYETYIQKKNKMELIQQLYS